MATSGPMRPGSLVTVLFEPDEREVLAVLPGALWLSPGDIVELSAPPREARVLSSRLQLGAGEGEARVLVVLDVPDEPLPAAATAEAVLGIGTEEPPATLSAALDRELAALGPEEGASEP